MEKRTLQDHIQDDIKELDDVNVNGQRKRHLQDELQQLEQYQANHPEETRDPSPLELYCDSHPEAPECRIYED